MIKTNNLKSYLHLYKKMLLIRRFEENLANHVNTLSEIWLHPDMFNSSNEIKPLNVEKIDKSCWKAASDSCLQSSTRSV